MPPSAHLGTPQHETDERSSPRRHLRLHSQASAPNGESANAIIHNASAGGLLIETALPLALGEEIAVNLPEAGEVGARVAWCSGKLFGCRFEHEISQAALSAAQLRSDALLPQADASARPVVRESSPGLGKRIEQLRKARGLTLADVAAALRVSKPTVWAWEKGKARPLGERMPALARVLDVEPGELARIGVPVELDEILAATRRAISAAYRVESDKVQIMLVL